MLKKISDWEWLDQARAFTNNLKKYFSDYGGAGAMFLSPLLWIAIVGAALSYREWQMLDWADRSQNVIPGLLGFSLGTYALLFSLISPRIRHALHSVKNSNGKSYFAEMNATFLHFIFVQVIAVLWAFFAKLTVFSDLRSIISSKWPSDIDLFPILKGVGGFIGICLYLYAFLFVVAASITVYRISKLRDPKAE